MNTSNIDTSKYNNLDKEFWDSLHTELLKSKKEISQEDIFSYVEKSFLCSLFICGASHKELNVFRSILNFKDLGYLIFSNLCEKIIWMLLTLILMSLICIIF